MITSFTGPHAFLSNFYPSPIYAGLVDMLFPTVEHAFQAAKTYDLDEKTAIAEAPTPGRAKRLGRRVTLRPDWEREKDRIMAGLITRKFMDPAMRALLVATDPQPLYEGNNWG